VAEHNIIQYIMYVEKPIQITWAHIIIMHHQRVNKYYYYYYFYEQGPLCNIIMNAVFEASQPKR